MNAEYAAFLASKAARAPARGMARVPELAGHLFPFQRHCVEFALRTGASGLFLDTGLGKTECQLEWCQKVIEATNKPALILTPLAVAQQTRRRAERWGYEARVIRYREDVGSGINICNYERLEKFDVSDFGCVALDEASVLKSFEGKTTQRLIEAFSGMQFKLAATATPAPNDTIELGRYAEFLDVMASREMVSRFFTHDAGFVTMSEKWRLKRYAEKEFWDWMTSFSRMAEKPSDICGSDEGFILPPFEVVRHRSRDSTIDIDLSDMFGAPSLSATTIHKIKRQTSEARAEAASAVVKAERDQPWIIWVDTNYEADAVRAAIDGAVEVRGSQSIDEKEEKLDGFARGKINVLIGKPSMIGFGSDWSHCARMLFMGRSFSYETWYQAVRRCWRFGQKRTVVVHLIVAEGEAEIGRVIDRKYSSHTTMKNAMRDAMSRATGRSQSIRLAYNPTNKTGLASWLTSGA